MVAASSTAFWHEEGEKGRGGSCLHWMYLHTLSFSDQNHNSSNPTLLE